jgi:hypothetical protein
MYRQHIETPLSIPEDLKQDMDFYAGEDRGRIYRILPEAFVDIARADILPGNADAPALIAMLAHSNGWMRRTAHRLLVERPDPQLEPALRIVLTSELPQARLHALYVLEAWEALSDADVRRALGDEHPGVRLHAIRLAETCRTCRPDVVRLAMDDDARVVMQVALSLGQFNDREALQAMVGIATRFAGEPWIRKALLSSARGSSMEMAELLAGSGFFSEDVPARQALLQDLAEVIGRRNETNEISDFVDLLAGHDPLQEEAWQIAALTGLRDGLESREARPAFSDPIREMLGTWKEGKPASVVELVDWLTG